MEAPSANCKTYQSFYSCHRFLATLPAGNIPFFNFYGVGTEKDGKNFIEAKREEYKVSKEKPVCFGNFGWTGCASTRYVRYQARSDKDLRGWLFTDEIIVK